MSDEQLLLAISDMLDQKFGWILLTKGWFLLREDWFLLKEGWFLLKEGWFLLKEDWLPLKKSWFLLTTALTESNQIHLRYKPDKEISEKT